MNVIKPIAVSILDDGPAEVDTHVTVNDESWISEAMAAGFDTEAE